MKLAFDNFIFVIHVKVNVFNYFGFGTYQVQSIFGLNDVLLNKKKNLRMCQIFFCLSVFQSIYSSDVYFSVCLIIFYLFLFGNFFAPTDSLSLCQPEFCFMYNLPLSGFSMSTLTSFSINSLSLDLHG